MLFAGLVNFTKASNPLEDTLVLSATLHFSYSETGKLVELEQRNAEGIAVRNTYYSYDSNDLFEGSTITYDFGMYEYSVFAYNDLNFCISKNVYDKYFTLKDSIIYKYNNQNQLVEESEYLSSIEIWYGTFYKYDSLGNVIQIAKDHSSKYDSYVKYEYGLQGKIIREAEYKREKGEIKLSLYREYSYDESGNNVKITVHLSDGKIVMEWLKKFDGNGKEIESTQIMEDNYLREKRINYYNEQGVLVRSEIFTPKSISASFLVYDE